MSGHKCQMGGVRSLGSHPPAMNIVNLHGSSGEPLAYACKRVRFCGVPLRNINM